MPILVFNLNKHGNIKRAVLARRSGPWFTGRGEDMVKDSLKALENKIKISAEHFRRDLAKLRTGRASLSLFEDIRVDYYGVLTPITSSPAWGFPTRP